MQLLKRLCFIVVCLVSGLIAQASWAQNYPNKPIRIFTSNAGANPDFVSRLVANELSPLVGQPVVVENRPAGPVLVSVVTKAGADGYSLLVLGGALWVQPLLEEASYDAVRDFSPIATLTRAPHVLVVYTGLPVQTVGDLIKLAKAKPGSLNYSSGTTGSSGHIAAELFKAAAGVDIVRIAYKTGPQAIADLMAGQVQLTFIGAESVGPLIKSGKVRLLGTAGAKRSPLYPDLPTVGETLPGYISESIVAFFAPTKTPDAVVRRLNQETNRLLEKSDVREKFLNSGQEPAGSTPEQLADTIKSEIARMGKLIKDTGMKAGG